MSSYEPGSPECRGLIDAKESLLNAMKSLSSIEKAEQIRMKLRDIYTELEEMHEMRRAQEFK